MVQFAQLRTGLAAAVLGQPPVGPLVLVQRLGGAAGAVQRQHQLPYRPLVGRVLGHQLPQRRHQFAVPARPQRRLVALDDREQPLVPQHLPELAQPGAGEVGERGTPPQCQRRVQRPDRHGRAGGTFGGRDQPLEPVYVNGFPVDVEQVSTGAPG